ncbi:MAG: beta-lactamase family protein [Verrucomicrobia bacterium]|nr:beta-lactamase family protein [Verrucomicrobiota bacterium]
MRRRKFALMLALMVPGKRSQGRSKTDGLANDRIKLAADYSAANRGKSLLVMQQGKILHESYSNGCLANEPHKIYSGTKSFWCLAALAAEEERILRLKDRAADTITEWRGDRLKSSITIRQLLDFSSGLDPFFELHEDGIKDRDLLAINRQLAAEPGEAFIYGPCSLQVFHEILKRKLAPRGQTPTQYLERHVLKPLGLGPQRYVADASGNPLLAAGFLLSARQWAQIGKVILCESNHVAPTEAIADGVSHGSRVNAAFGLGFWNNSRADRGGSREVDVELMLHEKWPKQQWRNACLSRSAPSDLVASIGSGSQRLYVVGSQDLIIVRQGWDSAFSDAEFLRLLFGRA